MPAVFALSTHLPYACRHSGDCCEQGWDIPIDEGRAAALGTAIREGRLVPAGLAGPRSTETSWMIPATALPGGEVGVLGRTLAGACVFRDLEGRRCAIQRACGHQSLPIACQQFPRLVLADDRGLHVTLSHACPTAAALLVDATSPPAIVEAAFRCPVSGIADIGLDARGHWPPLLRPGVLMSLDAWTNWERFAIATLGGADTPQLSLARLRRAAERLARWRPRDGAMEQFVRACCDAERSEPLASEPRTWEASLACWRDVWRAVPAGRAEADAAPDHWPSSESLGETLAEHSGPLGRYLAARAFAAWMAYQGHGVRSWVAALRATLGVVIVELVRTAGRRPSRENLILAFGRADRLLVHLAEPDALARAWNRADADCIRP
jgi:hypothetical protein